GDAPLRFTSAARRRQRLGPRSARRVPDRRLARRYGADRRHRPASQARPCARRLRSAARRDPPDHPAAPDAVQLCERRPFPPPPERRSILPTPAAAGPRLADALDNPDPAAALAAMVKSSPIPQRLRDVGFDTAKIDDAAGQIGALAIKEPRPVSVDDARAIL